MPKKRKSSLKSIVDEACKSERFSLPSLLAEASGFYTTPFLHLLDYLKSDVSEDACRLSEKMLIRFAFLIEKVKDDVTSTKYCARWSDKLSSDDPQKATFESCIELLDNASLMVTNEAKRNADLREVLKIIPVWGLSPHEFPINYLARTRPFHTYKNIKIVNAALHLKLLVLRQALLDTKLNPASAAFSEIMGKIHVKTYLTDRALTGDYKTNREKRWETHIDAPQFALREECFKIEYSLITQLLSFDSFPIEIIDYLSLKKIISKPNSIARCPVTLDAMSFPDLLESVTNKVHGRSAYQVGHLNPLKAGTSPEFRHAEKNISWISEDGNRIQGHLPLKETRALLKRISENYRKFL